MVNAVLLSVGDELLVGQVVNANAAWLGDVLTRHGFDVVRATAVGDDAAAIGQALADAFRDADVVVVTGGLGPTHDDVTREAVAAYFGLDLVHSEEALAWVRARYAHTGQPMPASNRRQALVPAGFTALRNPAGTAPGLWFEPGRGQALALLPGVPREMRALVEEAVLPRLTAREGRRVIARRTLLTAGLGESALAEAIGELGPWLDAGRRLAFLPAPGLVRLRLTALAETAEAAEARLDAFEAHLLARIGPHVFGRDDETLEEAVGALLARLGRTVAVAESCTGGLVLNRLTNVSGASAYVLGGVVAYGNSVKRSALGVDEAALDEAGAVSEAVARQMARGVRARLGADVGLATTGIAGPGGATPDKPVGLVWIGYADAEGDFAVRFLFAHDRLLNKELTATAALDLLRRHLGVPAPAADGA